MTKTISLSDDACEALAAAKRPGESFSDVARRLARLASKDALFDPRCASPSPSRRPRPGSAASGGSATGR